MRGVPCRGIAFIAWPSRVTGTCRASRGSQKSKLPTTRRQSQGRKSSTRMSCASFGTWTVWWPPSLLIEPSDRYGESLQLASDVFEDGCVRFRPNTLRQVEAIDCAVTKTLRFQLLAGGSGALPRGRSFIPNAPRVSFPHISDTRGLPLARPIRPFHRSDYCQPGPTGRL